MAVYDASGNAISLTNVHAFADRVVKTDLISNLFNRLPLLAFMAGKGGSDGKLGRPGASSILSGAKMNAVEKNKEGGVEVHDRHVFSKVGGFKYMGKKDTSPSTGTDTYDEQVRTAVFRCTRAQQAIKINNFPVVAAKGGKALGQATQEAVQLAMEEMMEEIAYSLWRGNPTSQSADVWDDFLGVLQSMDTDNTYGNLDRTTYTGYAGKRVTTAKAPSLSLIDDANFTQGAMDKSSGIDLVLTSNAIYNELKQEALSRGQTTQVGSMPQFAEVGVDQEGIKYGKTWITFDPLLTGNWSTYDSDVTDATKVFACFNTEHWVFSTNATENFNVEEFVDQGKVPGGDDALTSRIKLMARFRCRKPQNSVLYTNVG